MKFLTTEKYLTSFPSNDIIAICEPLKYLGINHFTYNRIYEDDSKFFLTTHNDFLEWVYKSRYSVASSFKTFITDGVYLPKEASKLLPSDEGRKNDILMHGANSYFNIDMIEKSINIVKSNAKFCEVFDFAGANHSSTNISFFINNLDLFQNFTFYFKEKAEDLILKAEKNRIKIKNTANPTNHLDTVLEKTISKNAKLAFLDAIKPSKVCLKNGNFLTSREFQCLMMLSPSFSAKEIASCLGTSQEIVEACILSIKRKLDCYEETKLIEKFSELIAFNC